MILWSIVSLALLAFNAVYCIRKIVVDFRGPTPASGVWGLFALAGAVSTIALMVLATLVAGSGI